MLKRIVLLVVAVPLTAAAVGGASTRAEPTPSTTVGVWLKEWRVIPSTRVASAGKVTFVVSNIGKLEHELVVIRTDREPNKLGGTRSGANEVGSRGEVEELRPPLSDRLTLTLPPGRYALICNLEDHGGHYKHGMFASFIVR
jgi:uncharacterized cupredoxin-like copper-binding protein